MLEILEAKLMRDSRRWIDENGEDLCLQEGCCLLESVTTLATMSRVWEKVRGGCHS